jgi:hypothetical protein
MLSSINIPKEFDVQGKEKLIEEMISSCPEPLAASLSSLKNAETPLNKLSIIARDTIPTLFQYVSLIMLCDYAEKDIPRSIPVFQALETMLFKPGPGKWLGFLRELTTYYRKDKIESSFPGILTFIEDFYLGEFNGEKLSFNAKTAHKISYSVFGQKNKLAVLDFLVTFRNRYAHSKSIDPSQASEIEEVMLLVILKVFKAIESLKDIKLTLESYNLEDQVVLNTAGNGLKYPTNGMILRLKTGKETPESDFMLLEELIQDKQAIFSSSLHSRKLNRKNEDEEKWIHSILQLFEKVKAIPPELTLDNCNYSKFSDRAIESTTQTFDIWRENSQIHPDAYIPPQEIVNRFSEFLASDKTFFIISAPQGRGKSSLAIYLSLFASGCQEQLELFAVRPPELSGNVIPIFIESQQLNIYKDPKLLLEQALRDKLLLGQGTVEDFLGKVLKKDGDKLLLVIDALNELTPLRMEEGCFYTPKSFFEDIIGFVRQLPDNVRKKCKILFTWRWDGLECYDFNPEYFNRITRDCAYLFFEDRTETSGRDACASDIEVPMLSFEEQKQIFYSMKNQVEFQPLFDYSAIPENLRKELLNPLWLRIFMQTMSGKEKVELANLDDLKKHYLKLLFIPVKSDSCEEKRIKDENRKFLINDIFGALKKKLSSSIVLNPDDPDLQDFMSKYSMRNRNPEDNRDIAAIINDFENNHILQTELIRFTEDDGEIHIIKKLKFSAEMIGDYLFGVRQKIGSLMMKKVFRIILLILILVFVGASVFRFTVSERNSVSDTLFLIIVLLVLLGFSQIATCTINLWMNYTEKIIHRWEPASSLLELLLKNDASTKISRTFNRSVALPFGLGVSGILLICVGILLPFHLILINDLARIVLLSVLFPFFLFMIRSQIFSIFMFSRIKSINILKGSYIKYLTIKFAIQGGLGTAFLLLLLIILWLLLQILGSFGTWASNAGYQIENGALFKVLGTYIFPLAGLLTLFFFLLTVTGVFTMAFTMWVLKDYKKKHKLDNATPEVVWNKNLDDFNKKIQRAYLILLALSVCLVFFIPGEKLDLGGTAVSYAGAANNKIDGVYIEYPKFSIWGCKPTHILLDGRGDDVSPADISNLDALEDCKSLKWLDLVNTEVTSISPLKSCVNLEILYICRTRITNLYPLENLPSFSRIIFHDVPIRDLFPLTKIESLESLSLKKVPIRDLYDVVEIPNLSELVIGPLPNISDLHKISEVNTLKELQMEEISPEVLKTLDLPDGIEKVNFYKDIDFKGMQHAKFANGKYNQLSTIWFCDTQNLELEKLVQLPFMQNAEEIYFRDTKVTSVELLLKLKKLKKLIWEGDYKPNNLEQVHQILKSRRDKIENE